MEFYEHKLMWQHLKQVDDATRPRESFAKLLPMEKFYASNDYKDAEWKWHQNGRPYYNVYPSIVPYLIKLKEEKVQADQINLPVEVLLFRFAKSEKNLSFLYNGAKYQVRSMLAHKEDGGIVVGVDWGATRPIPAVAAVQEKYGRVPRIDYAIIFTDPGRTVEQSVATFKEAKILPPDIVRQLLRIVCACCLLSNDAEDGLIEPDVFAEDKNKFDESGDQKYVDKAVRRGKIGWNIGAKMEVSPHWRSGCPLALYHTGPGRTIPIYRPRAGCIVKRNIASKLPTGYQGGIQ